MQKAIHIGLLGAGTVGMGVIKVLQGNRNIIAERAGTDIHLKTVFIREEEKSRKDLAGLNLTSNIEDVLQDGEIDIVIELMGGLHPAKEFMLRAMEAGKHVVTANKDVIAEFGKEIFATAKRQQTDFLFEASVGGGIPIVMALRESLTANEITEVMGIVNGTTNYMLTKMADEGREYDDVLKEAQEKGYAEANPASDVEGLDAARKAAILASLAFNAQVSLHDVSVEGITKITKADIDYAKELGYVIKLLAIGHDSQDKGIDVRVHPMFLPKAHPLASVNDVFNAIFVRGNAIGEAMFYGRGAGSLPTASAVVSDVLRIARNIVQDNVGQMAIASTEEKKICPLEDTVSSYYVRLLVDDQPGVLGAIATTFGKQGVSLKSVIQTRRIGDRAEIVVITHHVMHRFMEEAVNVLKDMPVVTEVRSIIRVENDLGA